MPVGECVAHMAPNTATEDALLELYMTLSRAEAQLYLFNDTIAFIERHVVLHSRRVILFHVGLLYSSKWQISILSPHLTPCQFLSRLMPMALMNVVTV
jgi:hypothetical protein